MAASRDDIQRWLDEGKKNGATHMIVVCDTYDFDDFPSYVKPGESVKDKIAGYTNPNSMSKVMEVYSFALDLDQQLNEHRAYHVD